MAVAVSGNTSRGGPKAHPFAFALALLLLATNARAEGPPDASTDAAWSTWAEKGPGVDLKERTFLLSGRPVKVQAAGEIQVTRDEDGKRLVLEVPLSARIPMHCEVYDEPVPPASTLMGAARDAAKRHHIRVGVFAVTSIEALEKVPVLLAEAVTKEADGATADRVQLLAVTTADRTIVCFRFFPDVDGEFRRAAKELAGAVLRSLPSPRGLTVAHSIARDLTDGHAVGFHATEVRSRRDGSSTVTQLSSGMGVTDTGAWMTEDFRAEQEVDATGVITRRHSRSVENAEVVWDYTLTRTSKNAYSVEGLFRGKSVNATLATADRRGLLENGASRCIRDELLTGKRPTCTDEFYLPAMSTEHFTVLTTRRTGAGPRTADREGGPDLVHLFLDEQGNELATEVVTKDHVYHTEEFFRDDPSQRARRSGP